MSEHDGAALAAGSALDVAVARVVFGWQLQGEPHQGGLHWWSVPVSDPMCDAFCSADAPPRYSTTWNGMGLVVAVLRTRGLMACLWYEPDIGCCARFVCWQQRPDGSWYPAYSSGIELNADYAAMADDRLAEYSVEPETVEAVS